MGLFDMLRGSKKNLEEKINILEKKLEICNNSLKEKQLHIDRTNAYWKRKMFSTQAKNAK